MNAVSGWDCNHEGYLFDYTWFLWVPFLLSAPTFKEFGDVLAEEFGPELGVRHGAGDGAGGEPALFQGDVRAFVVEAVVLEVVLEFGDAVEGLGVETGFVEAGHGGEEAVFALLDGEDADGWEGVGRVSELFFWLKLCEEALSHDFAGVLNIREMHGWLSEGETGR